MRKRLCLTLSATAALELAACVTVPNTPGCSAAGSIGRGMICAESLTDATWELTLPESLDLLEPQEARVCAPVAIARDQEGRIVRYMNVCAEHPQPQDLPMKLPLRSGAIVRPAADDNRIKTALEQACRVLGKNCKYEEVQKP